MWSGSWTDSRKNAEQFLAFHKRLCHALIMDIIGSSREKSTLYIAVLTLAFIGLALVVSTWQILRRQQEASMEHLELTAIAVLQAVDSSLRRSPMGNNRFSTDTRNFFRDLEASGDILFVGMVDEIGKRLGVDGEDAPMLHFPADALAVMKAGFRWQGATVYGSEKVYVALRRIQRATPGESGRLHRGGGSHLPRLTDEKLFLAVAVNMEKHFATYQEFRKTALFQTAYILAAAVFLWALVIRFLSRRKLAGKAVMLEQFQAKLLDNLPDGLLLADASGRVFAVNPAARAILSVQGREGGQDLVGSCLKATTAALVPPIDPTKDNGWQQAVFNNMHLELRVLSLPPKVDLAPEDNTPSLMVIIRDRTHIRFLENNLAEAENLAAIGSLAAGVAHEIRNPLSALRGFAQYFAKKLAGKQPEEEYARTMVRESDRLNRVVTDLLYLARPHDLARMPVSLAGIRDEMASLLSFELREQGVALDCALDAPTVNADSDALKQALLNLLLNALEALNGFSGTSRCLLLSSEQVVENGFVGIRITVADSGPGMTEEEQKQACKPFFTTKKKGTGLGLALVRTIMRGHGGSLAITSPYPTGSGGGCAVSLFFPDGLPDNQHAETSGV